MSETVLLCILLFGAMLDPGRNMWIIDFGIVSSAAVIPCAFIFGAVRGVPLLHSVSDASFGAGALHFLIAARLYAGRGLGEPEITF